ncbi:Reverse transcriptase domain [Arabidopsis thaliana x Arabidopsis arenosa]|uniref:Reverse transcriptase domain n=1 Tax=Arabidopsis thaliana x Arabidopsis arenosa TaxID=1240361 RepID=A0A8T2AV34_9BRAS|nr:Reverse transcriptase domain [Arabidopsis thaliana x Arabidopsis arenosa]
MPPAALPPQVDGDLGKETPVDTVRVEGEEEKALMLQEKVLSDTEVVTVEQSSRDTGNTEETGVSSVVVSKTGTEEGQSSESECVGDEKKEQNVTTKGVISSQENTHASWVAAVQNTVETKKVELEVEEIDGMPTARIPDSVFEDAQPLWEDFLIGKFLAKAPFVGGIHALVNKIWTLGDKTVRIDVFVVDQTTVRFRIKDDRIRNRVLRRGMWNLCGVPVVLSKWSPIVDTEQAEIKTIPLWVIVKNVPPKYFSWKVLSAITSPLGTPKKLHPDTEACKSFEEAKVFIEVDLTKKLPKFFAFKSEKGGDTIVEFVYPWLPPRCTECKKWGHSISDCLKRKIPKEVQPAELKISETVETEHPIVTSGGKHESLDAKEATPIVEANSKETENSGGLAVEIEEGELQWQTPTKIGRSPTKATDLRYGEVSIMTNSFSCLSDKGEQGEHINLREEDSIVVEKVDGIEGKDNGGEMIKDKETVIKKSGLNEGTEVKLRESLPRASKEGHKFLSTNGMQSSRTSNPNALKPRRQEEFFVSFIYASNFMMERKTMWNDLRNHHDSPLFQGKPWLICGDFNEILEGEEHSHYEVSPSIPQGMRDFQNLVSHCELTDLSYHGPRLTWCNKRHEGVICKKLDRVLVNKEWLQLYDQSYSVFEPGGCSDHLRCRFYIKEEEKRIKKPFKFTNTLTTCSGYQAEIEDFWTKSPPLYHSTLAMHMLTKKLKDLKPRLRKMGKRVYGDISIKTKAAFKALCDYQAATMINPTSQAVKAEAEAYEKWQRLSNIEEGFLHQRAKLHWMKIGDQNNKAYYNAVKIRENRNNIKEIQCEDGTIVSGQDQIKAEAERHFKDFLTIKPADYEEWSPEELEGLLKFQCDEADKLMLTKEVTEEEVRKTLFSMPVNKSPGPDGFTCEFFKETWSVVGSDFVVAIQSFFKTGFLPKGVNSTILALIPKKKEAKVMKDYRPISCCNVLYKVISKILANRLKTLLPRFISANQSAFIKDRLLMENLLLATEIIKDYHKDSVSPRCAMKIDISKAFDSVQWSFLLNTLRALHFPETFIHWIKICITTASFSVQVNGELAGYFGSERGLRQGCSLSPYLFVICMNVLSKKIDKAASDKKISLHPNCKQLSLTHLCFADDLMVFVKGDKKSIQGTMAVFDDFATHSGLKISLEKSTIYMAGISETDREVILQQFPFEYGSLPVRYLGLPLLTRRMTASDYLPLVEKIRSQISTWTARALSFAGRLQLLSSVVFSLINFWIAAFRLPKACIREIDKLCSAFLWSGPSLNPRKAKVAWEEVCTPKSEGGLGLRSIAEANKVSMLKLIWRLLSAKGSLWVDWVQTNLIRRGSFWAVKNNTSSGSWIWRKLLKYRDKAKEFHRVEVKNGVTTSFWFDSWSSLGCINEKLGDRGYIDLGIPKSATVGEVMAMQRRRKHRSTLLNQVEEEIKKQRLVSRVGEEDIALWRGTKDNYRKKFITRETWMQTRNARPTMEGYQGIWFSHSTPRRNTQEPVLNGLARDTQTYL